MLNFTIVYKQRIKLKSRIVNNMIDNYADYSVKYIVCKYFIFITKMNEDL